MLTVKIRSAIAKVPISLSLPVPLSIFGKNRVSAEKTVRVRFFQRLQFGLCFCQNFDISHNCKGVEVSDGKLIDIMKNLVDKGANNINLVNPTHYSAQLLRVFEKYKPPIPIVYNTSGYDSVETLRLFDGIVDVYLPDFKYIDPTKPKNTARRRIIRRLPRRL